MILDEEGSPRNNFLLISVDSRKKNGFTVASRALLAKLELDKLQMSKEHFRHKTAQPLA